MTLRSIIRPLIFISALLALSSFLEARAQSTVVRMTGVRFAYPLVEHWIDQYSKVNPDVQVVIEWRGQQDPSQYDILVEAFEQPEEIKKERDYTYVARYAILPVANSKSDFAKTYVVKGLTGQLIRQVFFHDLFADRDKEEKIAAPFTTYTRLQKAGSPMVFASYFKFDQKDIKGKGIAGSDEHLLKAVLRDSTGVSYLPTPMIYAQSGVPITGLTPLPVDLNGNDRVSDDETFFGSRSTVIERLSVVNNKDIHNLPIEHIHLSVDKKTASPEALAFIRWVENNGLNDLKDFGYLAPAPLLTTKLK
jgi:phosphate transport system substrate-binding protein